MTHAERCPVCNGTGKLQNKSYSTSSAFSPTTCHGCNGKGWIKVSDHYSGTNEPQNERTV
jgi:DnaJ-class molecular chaperone